MNGRRWMWQGAAVLLRTGDGRSGLRADAGGEAGGAGDPGVRQIPARRDGRRARSGRAAGGAGRQREVAPASRPTRCSSAARPGRAASASTTTACSSTSRCRRCARAWPGPGVSSTVTTPGRRTALADAEEQPEDRERSGREAGPRTGHPQAGTAGRRDPRATAVLTRTVSTGVQVVDADRRPRARSGEHRRTPARDDLRTTRARPTPTEVKNALFDAMLDHSHALTVGADEWLAIAAHDDTDPRSGRRRSRTTR